MSPLKCLLYWKQFITPWIRLPNGLGSLRSKRLATVMSRQLAYRVSLCDTLRQICFGPNRLSNMFYLFCFSDPMPQHAEVMVNFARTSCFRIQRLTSSLEAQLGPGTADLGMYVGQLGWLWAHSMALFSHPLLICQTGVLVCTLVRLQRVFFVGRKRDSSYSAM